MHTHVRFAVVLASALTAPALGQIAIDFDDDDEPTSNTEAGFVGFTIDDSGSAVGGVTITFNDTGIDDRDRDSVVDDGAFTFDDVYDDFLFFFENGNVRDVLTLSGLTPLGDFDLTLYAFDPDFNGGAVAEWSANGSPLLTASFENDEPLTSNDQFAFTGRATASALGEINLTADGIAGGSAEIFINALEIDVVPEPTSLALVGFAGLMLARRR